MSKMADHHVELQENLHTILAALDDYEQTVSEAFEASDDPYLHGELQRASKLYDFFDAWRVSL